jgi:hypothetical protein
MVERKIRDINYPVSSIVVRLMTDLTKMYSMLFYSTLNVSAMVSNFSFILICKTKLRRKIFVLKHAQSVTYF